MRRYKVSILVTVVMVLVWSHAYQASAAGKTYSGSDGAAHCTLWSTDRLRWPQTILGREKAECRRRAERSTEGQIQCRLKRTYIDAESGERLCIYQRAASGQGDLTMSMSPQFSCERSISCKQE